MTECTLPTLQLKTLAAISQVIDTTLDLETALQNVLRILSETLSMARATITLKDAETGQLVIAASHGLTTEEKERGIYALGEGVIGTVFQTVRPYFVEDIHSDPLFLDKTGARRLERGRVSFFGVPIVKQGQPVGVLNVDRLFDDDVLPTEDMEFLGVVATLVAQFFSLNEQVVALKRENVTLRHAVLKQEGRYTVGTSRSMQIVQHQLERVAPTGATVLLLGESGVGKTLIARLIHDVSDRKRSPFVKVNCASIPANLLEAELFGHEKGAFTGALGARIGRFEEANGGTIFLDEIGELDLALQAKLLRVIQEKEFERIGSNKTRLVQARIVAATNRNLARLVETGEFRQDLYYRLQVFPIAVPALRERREDIPDLLDHFIRRISREYGRDMQLDASVQALFSGYHWPGNVREMEHVVERLAILSERSAITVADAAPLLEQHVPASAHEPDGVRGASCALPFSVSAVEGNSSGASGAGSMERYGRSRTGGAAEHSALPDGGIPPGIASGVPRDEVSGTAPGKSPDLPLGTSSASPDAPPSASPLREGGRGDTDDTCPGYASRNLPPCGCTNRDCPHCSCLEPEGLQGGMESTPAPGRGPAAKASGGTGSGCPLSGGRSMGSEHGMPAPASAGPEFQERMPHAESGDRTSLHEAEVRQVLAALERNGWVQHKAAADLGITARQIGYRIKKFNLSARVAMERARLRDMS